MVALLVAGRPLLEGLLTGVLAAAAPGLALGLVGLDEIIFIDVETSTARGLVIDGMERGIGISIFTILLAGLVAGDGAWLGARVEVAADTRGTAPKSGRRSTGVAAGDRGGSSRLSVNPAGTGRRPGHLAKAPVHA